MRGINHAVMSSVINTEIPYGWVRICHNPISWVFSFVYPSRYPRIFRVIVPRSFRCPAGSVALERQALERKDDALRSIVVEASVIRPDADDIFGIGPTRIIAARQLAGLLLMLRAGDNEAGSGDRLAFGAYRKYEHGESICHDGGEKCEQKP